MVAKITMPRSIHSALNYNEHKVQKGKAECLHVANTLSTANDMNFYQKLAVFENLNVLNERASTKTLHVSLNFDPSEKHNPEKLQQIATAYMDKIGFGEQPYLVYQHNDAGHPHIHIVSTTVQADGRRINTHNIGRNQSETARIEIELEFGLVKANAKTIIERPVVKSLVAAQVEYGKAETKQSITNVLSGVIEPYNYTSLPELNAVLKQYHVLADPGVEGGRIFTNKGLIYRILDSDGNKTGVPIKASAIFFKPTLAFLEAKFETNRQCREPLKKDLKNSIDAALTVSKSLQDFQFKMAAHNVMIVLRRNEQQRLYGITFVDHKNKAVFNGSELAKSYSIAALQSRLAEEKQTQPISDQESLPKTENPVLEKVTSNPTLINESFQQKRMSAETKLPEFKIVETLLNPENTYQPIPYSLLKKKKKRKGKRNNN